MLDKYFSALSDSDPRSQRTKQSLVQALKTLLKTHEFRRITVRDITEQAGINRATFYAHFTDKYDLLGYMVRITLGEKLMEHMPDGCGFSAENLHLLIVVVCEFLSDYTVNGCATRHYDAQTYYIASQAQACVNEILASWLSKLPFEHTEGYSSREVVSQALSWAIFGPATRWLQNGHKTTPQELAACIVPFALSALLPVLTARH